MSIVSVNDLAPVRRQAITRTNATLLSIGPLATNFNEIRIEIKTFHPWKCISKCRLRNWQPFCLGGVMETSMSRCSNWLATRSPCDDNLRISLGAHFSFLHWWKYYLNCLKSIAWHQICWNFGRHLRNIPCLLKMKQTRNISTKIQRFKLVVSKFPLTG